MKLLATSSLGAFAAVALMSGAMAETRLTIATVNNGDMIRMQKLTDDFTKMNGYVVTARAATRLV